jgi:hypothetical protein
MDDGLKKITKIYEHLNYFDQYGGTFVLFITMTIVLILVVLYFQIIVNTQPIIDDWPNQRCKPHIMPFAGLITKPDGVSATEYTAQNFNYCMQNTLSSITGEALSPLTFFTNFLQKFADHIQTSIQSVRQMFDKVRTNFQNITEEIMGRLMNVMIPLIQIIISFRDLIGKAQGTLVAGLYTFIGSYNTLQASMGAIAQAIVSILISLAATIAVLWLVPFTWGAAAANTAIFVSIAIPMSIILAFMNNVLKVKTNLSIPTIKCFDKNTSIKMKDGTCKLICNIKTGDILWDNNYVTAIIKVVTTGSVMYSLHNIIVSDSHIVRYKNKWLPVCEHPDSIRLSHYNEPYLYCLNTSQKVIKINNILFTDWDELYEEQLSQILFHHVQGYNTEDIHNYLDYGFVGSTKIKLQNGSLVNIRNVNVNDVLENGDFVYGIVEIDGIKLIEQCLYDLGNSNVVEGYIPGLKNIADKWNIKKEKVLYNLLTTSGTFNVSGHTFQDYNGSINRYLQPSVLYNNYFIDEDNETYKNKNKNNSTYPL